MKKFGKYLYYTFVFLFIYLTFVLIYSLLWKNINMEELDISTILFQLHIPMQGANLDPFYDLIIWDTIGAIASALLVILACKKIHAAIKSKHAESKIIAFSKYFGMGCSICIFVITFIIVANKVGLFEFIEFQTSETKIYEQNYVNGEKQDIVFKEKRNLIYISLESIEVSFSDSIHGGTKSTNLIPNLTQLAINGECFNKSDSNSLVGAYAVTGTTWTIGSFVAQTSGVPLTIPIQGNDMNAGYKTFLPGVYSLYEILNDNGYTNKMILGSSKNFSGLDVYLNSNGPVEILDYDYALQNDLLPSKNYRANWGFEDELVFEFAKKEITELASKDAPFSVTMMTMDTHFPDGYKCSKCEDKFDDQYVNSILCSDKQIFEFVEWIKEQPFYENTTIVLVGDHPTMKDDFIDCEEGYDRTDYFAVINSCQEYTLDRDRKYTTLDVFPTIVSSIGGNIEGDRLGLGVNLFSDTKTLLEQKGIDYLNKEFKKHSSYYNNKLLYGK